jgi:hypothetical protein
VARSQSTDGSGDEQGTLISFPRSKWVPDDGIQPLDTGNGHKATRDGDPPVGDDIDESVVQSSRSPAIEATDFWASGDTQEFVGVAPSPPAAPPAAIAESAPDRGGRTAQRRRGSVAMGRLVPRAQHAASLAAIILLAAGGTAVWQLLTGHPNASRLPTAARSSSVTYASTTGTDSAAVLAAHLHRPLLVPHTSSHLVKEAAHRVKPAHRAFTPVHTEAVSYHAPVTTTPANNVTTSSSTYAPPTQTASNPPQNSSAATTASASGGSGSGSTGQPARPGPNGFLTCISNCG